MSKTVPDGQPDQPGLIDPLENIDFAQAWIAREGGRREPDDSSFWDGRAASFAARAGHSAYTPTFLEYAAIQPGETVFDMGCGSGTLALPLAREGHKVTAVDFSGQMLAHLEEASRREGLEDRIARIQASWEDDWDAAGVPVCDVAIASRSIAVCDLKAALDKLSAHARRRICLTLPTRDSPRYDKVLWEAVGRKCEALSSAFYCLGILFQAGIEPELRMIATSKVAALPTYEQACENARESLGKMTDEENRLFEDYCKRYIVKSIDDEGNSAWIRDYDRVTYWAFISWDK